MKRALLFAFLLLSIQSCGRLSSNNIEETADSSIVVKSLDAESFRELIFDYTNSFDWRYVGDKPAIIDFYTDWCPPCKKLSPVLDQLNILYNGEVLFYKINTDAEPELASLFRIVSVPTLAFIPIDGEIFMSKGFIPKATLKKYIDENLLPLPQAIQNDRFWLEEIRSEPEI